MAVALCVQGKLDILNALIMRKISRLKTFMRLFLVSASPTLTNIKRTKFCMVNGMMVALFMA